jgi:hypothetical protein
MRSEGKEKKRRERKKRRKGGKERRRGGKGKGKKERENMKIVLAAVWGVFFFQSPEVCQKLGCHPEFLATGDFTTVETRVRGNRRLHRTSTRVLDIHRRRRTAIISCCQRGKRKKKKRRKEEKEEKKGRREEIGRKGEKKGRKGKGKEGKVEYEDSVGGYVFFFFKVYKSVQRSVKNSG